MLAGHTRDQRTWRHARPLALGSRDSPPQVRALSLAGALKTALLLRGGFLAQPQVDGDAIRVNCVGIIDTFYVFASYRKRGKTVKQTYHFGGEAGTLPFRVVGTRAAQQKGSIGCSATCASLNRRPS